MSIEVIRLPTLLSKAQWQIERLPSITVAGAAPELSFTFTIDSPASRFIPVELVHQEILSVGTLRDCF
jgi:hypothetical protein